MKQALQNLGSGLANLVTRAKIALAAYNAAKTRTLVQLQGLAGETLGGVELLLPYGMSAIPVGQGGDYLLFQVNNFRDHKVVIGGDDPSLRIPDLQSGEFGFRDARGQQIVFRGNEVEVTTSLGVVVNAPTVTVPSGDVIASGISLVNHVHGESMPGDGDTGKPVA